MQQLLEKRLEAEKRIARLQKTQRSVDQQLEARFKKIAKVAKEDFNRSHDICSISSIGILSPFAEYICAVSVIVRGESNGEECTFAGDSKEANLVRKFLTKYFVKKTGLSEERIAIFIDHPVILW